VSVSPNVLLIGPGPDTEITTCHDSDTRHVLKISRGNCYDHFISTSEHVDRDGIRLRIFRWTDRTYVAE
jgi:hypothetical protein